jgi:hypothetical protein
MSFEPQCPQCLFVSRELGQATPCLLHVALATSAEPEATPAPAGDYDEPYVFGQLHPTVDRPGPFTLREYVRLRLLRSRVQEQRSSDPPPAQAQAEPLARR